MITYTIDTKHSKTPQWWQRFIENKVEDAIDLKINVDNTREFAEYINSVIELRYDAYYDEGIFGKSHMLEFASNEGHMLFMMEWL